ncbi:MAG TPA: protein CapI [Rhodospirillaceae bacterium]|nr:MAG: protein CapI [Alphaproteobacteria bacterium GWF2_58_20]HAU29384.1 protein CapI [Rhodospirillaceae bacterium]
MAIIVTGAAGFIGFHVSQALLARGEQVIGIDCVNDYYDPSLKEARLAQLMANPSFAFHRIDISDKDRMFALAEGLGDVSGIVHLAAQAGVRYSLENPYTYITSNVMGHVVVLEMARLLRDKGLKHVVYASSSSVYGGNTKLPFSVEDAVETPVSLYAATKRTDELISHTYAHLYGLPQTGLRFFTVYGPWGRPDMAAYLFANAIVSGRKLPVFNNGNMKRDFTYVDDIVAGILLALDKPSEEKVPHRVFNLGQGNPVDLMGYISAIEKALGRKAELEMKPMQPGDVPATYADIEFSRAVLGYEPKVPVSDGIPRFIEWYKDYYKVS